MTPAEAEALRDIRGYAAAGRVEYTRHARQRMGERGVVREDVECALRDATRCESEPQERWRVYGVDRDGVDLVVVVVLEAGVLVVTLF